MSSKATYQPLEPGPNLKLIQKHVGPATTAHLTSIPLDRSTHNSESAAKAADIISYQSKASSMTSKDIWNLNWKKMVLKLEKPVKNLGTTRWKPSKNIPRCNLRPQTVTLFFRPKKSWRDCDCGDIQSTGLTLPLVPWVDAAFFWKNVYDVLYRSIKICEIESWRYDWCSGCKCSEHPSAFSHGQSHSLQLRLELCQLNVKHRQNESGNQDTC